MNIVNLPRLMLVGTGSGCGKTTLTCALLRALQNRSLKPASFKCGPDYIDPMFHSKVLGAKSRNLDLFLCGEETVKSLLAENSKGFDLALIEGVMGMYDGLSNTSSCSSNELALATGTPEILVVNTKGMSRSLAAHISGYLNFDTNNIKGVLFNNTAEAMYPFFKEIVERELRLPVLGNLPEIKNAAFDSRHLGLVTADEIEDIRHKLDLLATACERCIDIDGLLEIAKSSAPMEYRPLEITSSPIKKRIAVARDRAFCFYYEDNFMLLEKLGAELVFFSPMEDSEIPENVDAIILGGGYPEIYAAQLSCNLSMHKSIRKAYENGLSILAECGGYMYLCKEISDGNGISYPMVGLLESTITMGQKLSRFGYKTLTAETDNLLCKAGESIRAHEFHYSDSSNNGGTFNAVRNNGAPVPCIHGNMRLYAGYPHLHLWGNTEFAKNFINNSRRCNNDS